MLEIIKNAEVLQTVRNLFAKNVKDLAHRLRDDHNSIWSYHGIDDVSGNRTEFIIYIGSGDTVYKVKIMENNAFLGGTPYISLYYYVGKCDDDLKVSNHKPKDFKELMTCIELAGVFFQTLKEVETLQKLGRNV